MQRALFLNVVVGQRAAVLQLLASEDEALLVRRNPLLVLNLRLHIVDGIGRLHIEGDGLAGERLHEDLHRCKIRKLLGTFQAHEILSFVHILESVVCWIASWCYICEWLFNYSYITI